MNCDVDRIAHYTRKITNYPRISREREVELSKIIIAGRDVKKVDVAINELVLSNLRLVLHCLKDYTHFLDSSDICLSTMDLISEGNVALIAAAKGFDAEHVEDDYDDKTSGSRFSTYACRCIRSRMQRAIKLARLIHIPERHFTYRKQIDLFISEDGDVSDKELSKKIGVNEQKLDLIRQGQTCKVYRMEDASNDDESNLSIESLADPNQTLPDREAEKHDLHDYILGLLNHLPQRTKIIISELYLSQRRITLEMLSKRFQISKERCRQICIEGLKKLRVMIEKDLSKSIGDSNPEIESGRVPVTDTVILEVFSSFLKKLSINSEQLSFVA